VVTGTFRKERNHGLRALHVSVAEEVSCLRVTSGHPVWSVTRGAWIGAGELVPGEALAAWRGEPVAVLANLPEADTATWNLEVENEHVYRVGPAGILVHNTCPTPKELFEGGGAGAAKTPLQEVVEGSRMEGKHLVYDLDDGGKVFIRKESHPLPDSGGADVPHWNIEVMRPRNDRLGNPLPGQYKPALDTHITLDPSGKPDGIFHTGPRAPKK